MRNWQGALIGAILLFSVFAYMNYNEPYCTEFPLCTDEEAIQIGTDCCPPQKPFNCFGFIQSQTCTFTGYLVNPYGFGSLIIGFLSGAFIQSMIRGKR